MLSIRRGTTVDLAIGLKDVSGSEYNIAESDKLIFGVKSSVDSSEYILSKEVTPESYNENSGRYVLNLKPEDTAELPFGKYVYDVGLQTATGDFYIVCPCDTFVVSDVVTKKVI